MRDKIEPDPIEDIARRSDLINRILEGHTSKHELKSVTSISGSTLNRAIRCLEDRGIIKNQNQNDGYTVTSYGRLALGEYERLVDRFEALAKVKPLLRELGADSPVNMEMVQDAEVIMADSPDPRAPLTRLDNLVEGCHSIVALMPIIQSRFVTRIRENITQEEVEVDLIMGATQVEHLFASYGWTREVIDHRLLSMHWIRDTPDFGVVLVDENRVWIGVYDETNSIQGALLNDTPIAVEWAKETLEESRSQGDRVRFRGASSSA